MYEQDLALKNLQELICHQKPTNQPELKSFKRTLESRHKHPHKHTQTQTHI